MVREHRKARVNSRVDAKITFLKYFVIKSEFLNYLEGLANQVGWNRGKAIALVPTSGYRRGGRELFCVLFRTPEVKLNDRYRDKLQACKPGTMICSADIFAFNKQRSCGS